jgi:hypothetical protein
LLIKTKARAEIDAKVERWMDAVSDLFLKHRLLYHNYATAKTDWRCMILS